MLCAVWLKKRKKETWSGYMRPKRCREWEELLYQMERREIKMHCGVEKHFDLHCRPLNNFWSRSCLHWNAQLRSVFKYLCRRWRATSELATLTLGQRPRRLSSKGTVINSPYFSDCQQIPHKKHKPSTITLKRNACGLSQKWLLHLYCPIFSLHCMALLIKGSMFNIWQDLTA